MGNNILKLAVVMSLLVMSVNAIAATRYISDELSINLRRGPSTSYSINKLLKAGTKVQTLKESNGWTQVRTPKGSTGYVLTRFLSSEPAARVRIDHYESQAEKLKKENNSLHSELAEALHGSKQLGELKSKLISENKSLKAEVERIKNVSADAIKLNKQNQAFREKMLSTQSELERLRSENKALQSRREGMKIGALILVGGVVLGLLLPMFRRRRKNNWDSL